MKITKKGQLEIYSIGIDKVPTKWELDAVWEFVMKTDWTMWAEHLSFYYKDAQPVTAAPGRKVRFARKMRFLRQQT